MLQAVCLIGYPGAGKSNAMRVAEAAPWETETMGDVLRSRAAEERGEWIRDDGQALGEFGTEKRSEHHDAIVADWLVDQLDVPASAPGVVIDGMQSRAERDIFVEHFDLVHTVLVDAPFQTRLERIQQRGRENEDGATADYLRERDHRQGDWGLHELVWEEDYEFLVRNTGTQYDLTRATQLVLELLDQDATADTSDIIDSQHLWLGTEVTPYSLYNPAETPDETSDDS